MRNCSARDLLLALPHYKNEFDIINRANDTEVYEVLDAIGIDTLRGIGYAVNLHRDMQGKIAVGFILSGEYNRDPKYKNFLDTTDRVILASMDDPSLGRDMIELMGRRYNYKNDDEPEVKVKAEYDSRYYSPEQLLALGYTGEPEEEEYDGTVSENYDVITSQIKTMSQLLSIARSENE